VGSTLLCNSLCAVGSSTFGSNKHSSILLESLWKAHKYLQNKLIPYISL
jgi:hypothetical protein